MHHVAAGPRVSPPLTYHVMYFRVHGDADLSRSKYWKANEFDWGRGGGGCRMLVDKCMHVWRPSVSSHVKQVPTTQELRKKRKVTQDVKLAIRGLLVLGSAPNGIRYLFSGTDHLCPPIGATSYNPDPREQSVAREQSTYFHILNMPPSRAGVFVVSIFLPIVATITVALRFILRRNKKAIGSDDWTIAVALV